MSNHHNIGKVIYSALNGQTAAGDKVFPVVVPVEKGVPAIAYNVMTTRPDKVKDFGSAVDRVVVELAIMDNTRSGVIGIASACRSLLENHVPSSGETYVDQIRMEDDYFDYEETSNVHLVYQEYEVRIKNTPFNYAPVSINFPHGGGASGITIVTSGTWDVADDKSWISVSPASGSGNGTVTVTVSINSSGPARSGTVTITPSVGTVATINITQDAAII